MASAASLLCVLCLAGGVAAQAAQSRTDQAQAEPVQGARSQTAQPASPTATQPQTAQPHTVSLDVLVDGTTPSLTAHDFLVTQGGESLTIASVRLVVPGDRATPLPIITSEEDEARAAAEADRLVAIYIDEYHLSSGAAFDESRSSLAAFVRTSLGPRDLVVVVKPLASLVSIRLTSDRESAAQAIEGALARRDDLRPRSSFEQQYFAADPARIEAARSQIALSSLSALTTHLGRFANGRKTLIVLSDGLSPLPRTRSEAVLPTEESIARSANRARVAVYMVRPEHPTASGESRRGEPGSRADGSRVAFGARDASVRREPLAAIAERTTGLVMDAATSASGLRRVLGDASRYYLLDVVPPQPPDDQYRTVAITSRQPGVRLRARAGYALNRNRSLDAGADTPARALARVPRQTSRLIRVWFGQSAGSDGRTHVVFVWEPAPSVPGARTVRPGLSRVSLTVTASNGDAIFAGETIASGRSVIAAGPAADQAQASFDVVPGTLLAQIEILDAAGRVLDKDVRDILVRGLAAPGSFGTPAVHRARTAADLRGLREDLASAPVAARQFSRTESLVIRVATAGAADASVVSAKLVSGFGSVLRSLDVHTFGGSNPTTRQIELPLAALASGQYAVEFTSTARTRTTTIERIAFSVTP